MLAGLKLGRRIADQPAMRPMIESEYLPGAHVTSDEDMMEYIRNYGATVYHPVGTAKMGRDDMAVVDDQLRLHGIGGGADRDAMPRQEIAQFFHQRWFIIDNKNVEGRWRVGHHD